MNVLRKESLHGKALTMAAAGSLGVVAAIAGGALYAWNVSAATEESAAPATQAGQYIPTSIDVLHEAPGPTHTEPTPWGLFTINPVINGKSVLNPQGIPYPKFNGRAARTFETSGENAIAQALAAGMRVIDVPEQFRQGMQLSGVQSRDDGEQFLVDVGYFGGKGTTSVRTLRVTAFTPVASVTFEEFPDNAIWDFSASFNINGFPTLTIFPDTGTADPAGERIVAWSQGDAVYYIQTIGLFDNNKVIGLAREISKKEASR